MEYTNGIFLQLVNSTVPITPLFGRGSTCDQTRGSVKAMVNEQSHAKAPVQSAISNEQPTKQVEPAQVENPAYASSVPRFGQPTLPQSPLGRGAFDSKVFIKPKPRPLEEHHKEHHNTSTRNTHSLYTTGIDSA